MRALYSAPALGLVGAVFLLPVGQALWTSLHRVWRQVPHETPFVGLENYRLLLASDRFWAALGHTTVFTAGSVALELVLGLRLALLVHRKIRGRGVLRAAVLIPWVLPTVVSSLLWGWIYHDRYGLANHLLLTLGVLAEPRVWLGDPALAMAAAIVADIWKTTPYVALILLTGLQAVDPIVYEAAALDGAAGARAFRHLTLPLLLPSMAVALMFRTLDAFRVFDLIYVLTRGGPGGSTETVSVLAYQLLFQDLDFGRGAAMGILILAAGAMIGTGYLWALRFARGAG